MEHPIFRFLELPVEIRYSIYEILLNYHQSRLDEPDGSDLVIDRIPRRSYAPCTSTHAVPMELQPHDWPYAGLIKSCKQLHLETKSVLHALRHKNPNPPERILDVDLSCSEYGSGRLTWEGRTWHPCVSATLRINARFGCPDIDGAIRSSASSSVGGPLLGSAEVLERTIGIAIDYVTRGPGFYHFLGPDGTHQRTENLIINLIDNRVPNKNRLLMSYQISNTWVNTWPVDDRGIAMAPAARQTWLHSSLEHIAVCLELNRRCFKWLTVCSQDQVVHLKIGRDDQKEIDRNDARGWQGIEEWQGFEE